MNYYVSGNILDQNGLLKVNQENSNVCLSMPR